MMLNISYNECLDSIDTSLSEYVSHLGNNLYGFKRKSKSRTDLLNELCDPSQIDLFLDYEKKLADRGIVAKNYDHWNDKPIDFIAFYKFCESKSTST